MNTSNPQPKSPPTICAGWFPCNHEAMLPGHNCRVCTKLPGDDCEWCERTRQEHVAELREALEHAEWEND